MTGFSMIRTLAFSEFKAQKKIFSLFQSQVYLLRTTSTELSTFSLCYPFTKKTLIVLENTWKKCCNYGLDFLKLRSIVRNFYVELANVE